jgi:hypothetical protein
MKIKSLKTFTCEICIGGNYDDAIRICKEFCNEIGCCVTCTKTEFIYTNGQESGILIRLVQYPRFPKLDSFISDDALELTKKLINGLYQQSALIISNNETKWITIDNYKGK